VIAGHLQQVGTHGVQPMMAGQPAAPVQPAAAADRTAPRIAGLRLRRHGRAVRYRLSEAARVTITVRRRGKAYKAVTRRGAKGRNTIRLRRLPPGRYRLRAVARDAAGNTGAPNRPHPPLTPRHGSRPHDPRQT